MKNKFVGLLKNLSYSITANGLSLLISVFMILIVTNKFGVEEYGYYQLYTFYVSYAGFFTFGWVDGIYLRYGGKNYEDLDRSLFVSQFWLMLFIEIIFSILIVFWGSTLYSVDKKFIIIMFAINIIILSVRGIFVYVFQSTNKIREFAILTYIEKLVFLFVTILVIFLKINRYEFLVFGDLLGKFLSFIYCIVVSRDFVFGKQASGLVVKKEIYKNVTAGAKLLMANIASMLIIGIVRYLIELNWSIEVFGKVSFSMNLSNMIIIFINAIGIVLFPMLRKVDDSQLKKIYTYLSAGLMSMLFIILLFYYPMKVVLSMWLPHYKDSLDYLALLFPICLFESKMSLLINTFLKVLRKENLLLLINFISVFISAILSVVSVLIFKNIELSILTITIVLGFRCLLAEIIISKLFNIKVFNNFIFEALLVIVFVFTGWYIDNFLSTLIYLVFLLIYLYSKKKTLIELFRYVKR